MTDVFRALDEAMDRLGYSLDDMEQARAAVTELVVAARDVLAASDLGSCPKKWDAEARLRKALAGMEPTIQQPEAAKDALPMAFVSQSDEE